MLNSISNYSSIGTRKGIGGLASGLDTDALVEGMTQSTRNKLTKQLQSKEILAWRMTAYQGVSNKMNALSTKYMSFTSSTNLLSQSFFMNNIISSMGSNSKSVTATGNSDILAKLKINSVTQLASAAGVTTNGNASNNKISSGEIDLTSGGKSITNLAGESVKFQYDGKDYDVKISKDFKVDPSWPEQETLRVVGMELERAMKAVKTDIKDGPPDANGVQNYKSLSDVIKVSSETRDVDDGAGGEIKTTFLQFSTDAGFNGKLAITGGSQSALTALGLNPENKYESTDPTKPIESVFQMGNQTKTVNFADSMAGKSISFNLNGIEKTIVFPEDKTDAVFQSIGGLQRYLQEQFDGKFGNGKVKVNLEDGTGTDPRGKLSFATADPNSTLTFSDADEGIAGFKGALNIDANASNRLNTTKPLADANLSTPLDNLKEFKISINGVEMTFSKDLAVKDIISQINASKAGVNIQYLATTDKFSITASETGAQGRIDIKDVDGNLAEALFGKESSSGQPSGAREYTVTAGTDSIMEIDMGQGAMTITRSTNAFNLDGINFTLNSKFDSSAVDSAGKPSGGDAITFTSKSDTTKVVAAIKDFIKDYNELIASVNKEVSTRPNKSYTPLTAEQAEGMTESQIKEWETKAQEGLLFGDSTVNGVANDLRFVFSMEIPGLGMTLKDMGITVSPDYSEKGKLSLDEAKLTEALEKNPDAVMRAFTTPNENSKEDPYAGGIMNRVQNVVKKYASTTGIKGSLITLAGTDNALLMKDSALFKQSERIDKEILRLQKSLKVEEDRYFRQFTTLERYISQMNAQSSWLTGQ